MRYPMCADWLVFHRIDENTYMVENYLNNGENNKTKVPAKLVQFLRKLDGKTDPFTIFPDADRSVIEWALDYLSKNDMIRDSHFLLKSLFALVYTIHVFHPGRYSRKIACLLNSLLLLSFLPVLIIGILLFTAAPDFRDEFFMAGIFFGLVIGIIFHETGHAVAGMAYGARIFEAGLFLFAIILPGAYVLFDARSVNNKLRRVQIFSAGVEMNFLLAGLFLILSVNHWSLSGFFFGAAVQNMLLGLLNLMTAGPLDGAKIISALIGSKDFLDLSRKLVFHGDIRKPVWNRGLSGKAAVIAAYVISVVQIALPVLLLSEFAGVIIWIKDLF